ncbi:MAG: hypothetical protein WA116_02195 [Anaerolineaceae bacterium]
MKIKKLVGICLSILLIFILGAFANSKTAAQGKSIVEWLVPSGQDETAPILQVTAVKTGPNISGHTQISQEGNEVPSLGSIQNEIQTLMDLNAKASKELLAPGYLHIAKTKDVFLSASDTLADGSPIPQFEKIDEWYLLGENGEILEYVSITDTGDPKTSQVVIYQNKLFTNLTFPNMKSEAPEDFYLQSLDFGFSSYYLGKGNVASSIVGTTAESILIASKISLDQTVNFREDLLVNAINDVYTFTLDTGMVKAIETYLIQPNGTEILQTRTEIISVESVNGFPDNAAAYLG